MSETANTLQQAREHSESIKNDALKIHETFEPGDTSAQGDINVVCIRRLPNSAKARKNRQLAEGDTQGSRHVLRDGAVYDADREELAALIKQATGCEVPAQYIGPVFTGEGGPSYLAHPEHGDQQFPAESVCVTTYQRNLDQEEREQRVAD